MIGVKWFGWEGSEWDLRTGPVHLTKSGVQGLGSLESEVFTQTTALLDGQRFTGWRARPRVVLLPILIGQGATEMEWFATDRAWWETMRPDKPGTLQVTAPDGSSRTIQLRFEDDGGMQFDRDPTQNRLSVAVLKMVADDPWWKGKPFTQSFSAGTDPVNFFGGATGFGPPFFIGSANTLGVADVFNPGNIDTWPVYYVDGPASEFDVKIDGRSIAASMAIAADQQLQIDTHPTRQVALLITGGQIVNGVRVGGTRTNVTKLLESVNFATIPSGASVVLDISLNGTGRITLFGEPRHFRAW